VVARHSNRLTGGLGACSMPMQLDFPYRLESSGKSACRVTPEPMGDFLIEKTE
jgi:hypothetical protein